MRVGISARLVNKMVVVGNTCFRPEYGKIEGAANEKTEKVKDLLRRHGIRFKYYNDGEEYREWD